ncbi:hypothetical protein [Inquilinus sp. CAU 1745]|uniref:hypothetical protein n=1 Tax=Inquilinus sp. CAU 1745 TaxID=3140369 RepID=UPI00325BFC60
MAVRAVGWALVVLGLLILGRDVWRWADGSPFRLITGGELWFLLDSSSLNLTQEVIQRYLPPQLWDPAIVTMLLWPAALTIAAPGLLLILLGRRRMG